MSNAFLNFKMHTCVIGLIFLYSHRFQEKSLNNNIEVVLESSIDMVCMKATFSALYNVFYKK